MGFGDLTSKASHLSVQLSPLDNYPDLPAPEQGMLALEAHSYFTHVSRHVTLNQAIQVGRNKSVKVVTAYNPVIFY